MKYHNRGLKGFNIIVVDDTVRSEIIGFTNDLMKYLLKNNLYVLINRVDLIFDSTIVSIFDYSILWVENVKGFLIIMLFQ